MDEKRVLVITYKFPPVNSPGIYRVLGFIRHLPEYGFRARVVTAEDPFGDAIEPGLLDMVPAGTAVFRTRSFEADKLAEKISRALQKKAWPRRHGRAGGMHEGHGGDGELSEGRWSRIRKRLFVPDTQVGWIPFALFRSLLAMAKDPVDVIFTSSPPSSLQLTGLLLKKLTGKKWVADLRDPWSREGQASPGRLSLRGAMEKAVMKNADAIIANTPGMKKQICDKWKGIDGSKVKVITNGFDDDPPGMLPGDGGCASAARERLNITFIGTTYPGMVDTLFKVLGEMKKEGVPLAARVTVNLVGTSLEYERSLSRRHDIDDVVSYAGFVPHRETFQYMRKAHVLLLLLTNDEKGRTCIPSKLFNYILTGKPILALVPEGDAADVIRKTGTGMVVGPGDTAGVKKILLKLLSDHGRGIFERIPVRAEIQKYDRRLLTGKLAETFNEVLCEPHGVKEGIKRSAISFQRSAAAKVDNGREGRWMRDAGYGINGTERQRCGIGDKDINGENQ